MIYLVEWVCCKLAGEDTPRVPMDPPVFMLTPRSIKDAEYSQWGPGIPFID